MTSSSPGRKNPLRGELWWVDFNPTRGDEIRKVRPAIVVSTDGLGVLRLRVVVPCTSSRTDDTNQRFWQVSVPATPENGLNGDTVADPFQVKSVSLERFHRRIGPLESEVFAEVLMALNIVLGNE